MKENSKVSIITPSYNSEMYISETIEAIINQTYRNWELLITDDCSSDNTKEIVRNYQENDSRIKFFQLKKNLGAGIARNNSIEKARGRYIAFCDSDDVWKPDKLTKQIEFMERNALAFTYGAYQKMNKEGKKGAIFYPPECISFKDLLKTCSIGCLTAVYDIDKLGKMFMPSIRKRQDYALWLEIHKKIKCSKGIVDEPLAFYRVRSNSISSNKLKAAQYYFRVLKEYGDVNFVQSFYYFFYYIIKGTLKYFK
ncbi:glycosyltransferase involved in cell wall biosynthesis [Balneicella halophila]|uniref:Glycosyltransferase involved in cell wall biosynthesis n=1 Tax=Balneicella halophila TaxID=1537566 RepID=A0A7L4UNJ2_BALHA|nr:glycosyltransferase family 2 protein [Balneicella halophila]PVX50753.1 glycosyltransferase involved in cell wall biosynthesis [Balneicella halophila]